MRRRRSSRGLQGTEYAKIYRETGERDRHGDRRIEYSHDIGPGIIAWVPGVGAFDPVRNYPMEATVNQPAMYFKGDVPDVRQGDEAVLPNGTRYRVTMVAPTKWGSTGDSAGTEVRFVGVTQ